MSKDFLRRLAIPRHPVSYVQDLKSSTILVDPAKSLFFFMHRLWSDLEYHKLYPGFDIRSYTSTVLGSMIEVGDDLLYNFESGPNEKQATTSNSKTTVRRRSRPTTRKNKPAR